MENPDNQEKLTFPDYRAFLDMADGNGGNYLEKCPVRIWKRDIATSPHRSFNFQQLFFYDIFLRNAYFTSYRSSKYTTVN